MSYDLKDRIKGSMYAAGIGDALGVPSEAYSKKEIEEVIGCRIEKFYGPGENIYGAGNVPGEVTDDTSQMYEMIKQIIETKGEFTVDAAAKALINWTKNWPQYYPRNAGPTMRSWAAEYEAGEDPLTLGLKGKAYGRGISDGAAMRVAGAGLLNPGDLDGAIKTAVTMSSVSHGTQHAYSGACAIAAAIAAALEEGADVHKVVKAAIYGAKEGERIGLETARQAYGCRVLPKMMEAIKLGYLADSPEEAEKLIEDNIGATGDIQDAVAVVMGLIVANDGEVMPTLISCANFGGDTDTFACIAGKIVGALHGYSSIPAEFTEEFKKANPRMEFDWAADELCKIIEDRRA